MENEYPLRLESRNRRRTGVRTCLSAVVLLNVSTAAWAHHSFAMFDLQKPVEVKGTVREFRFGNPHSWIILSVKDRAGKSVDYPIETNGSFYLAKRQGWKRDSLKSGDVIVARVHPMRDGSPGGDLIKATLSDGRELIARVESPPVAPAEKK
jgi:hypothetical protein